MLHNMLKVSVELFLTVLSVYAPATMSCCALADNIAVHVERQMLRDICWLVETRYLILLIYYYLLFYKRK
jgi:hypothetical protein